MKYVSPHQYLRFTFFQIASLLVSIGVTWNVVTNPNLPSSAAARRQYTVWKKMLSGARPLTVIVTQKVSVFRDLYE